MKIFPLSVAALLLATAPFCGAAHAAEPTISATGVRMLEGDSGQTGATFRVTLSDAPTKPVRVSFATQPGTATSGRDYVAVGGALDFPAGTREQTVSIPIIGDATAERDESFFLLLSAAGYAVAQPAAACTIQNDDGAPTSGAGGPGKIVYEVFNLGYQVRILSARKDSNAPCPAPDFVPAPPTTSSASASPKSSSAPAS